MTEDADPLLIFFSVDEAADPDILYTALGVVRTAEATVIAKAYRKAALRCHPDKHTSKTPAERETLTAQFQRIGFAFAVLSDEKRRKRYDVTGRTDEVAFGDDGWDTYFADLFDGLDRKVLDEDKKNYQGSEKELEDLRAAYKDAKGGLEGIMASIPHSTHKDEARFIVAIEGEISTGSLKRTKAWSSSAVDKEAAKKRKRAAADEAAEAEEEAKRLGVWDEFYGSGAKGKRVRDEDKGKGQEKGGNEDDGALAALIRSRQNSRAANFAALEAKYAAKEKKGKKTKSGPHPEELDDVAFAALQSKMFGDKGKGTKRKTR